MNKKLSVLIMSLLLCLSAGISADPSPQVASLLPGSWSGSFQAGRYDPLELIFHIRRDGDGLSAVLDIPSQHRTGIPVGTVSVSGQRLMILIPEIQAEFQGFITFDDDGSDIRELSGDWSQSGEFVPLTLLPHEPGQ